MFPIEQTSQPSWNFLLKLGLATAFFCSETFLSNSDIMWPRRRLTVPAEFPEKWEVLSGSFPYKQIHSKGGQWAEHEFHVGRSGNASLFMALPKESHPINSQQIRPRYSHTELKAHQRWDCRHAGDADSLEAWFRPFWVRSGSPDTQSRRLQTNKNCLLI